MDYNKSLYEVVVETHKNYKNDPALYFENHHISYDKLLKEIDKIASVLTSFNVKPKDVVTVCMPNMPQAIYAMYAINKIGAICYEVHPKTTKDQMKEYLKRTNSKILLVIDIFAKNFVDILDGVTMITFNPYVETSFIKRMYCDITSVKNNKINIYRYESLQNRYNIKTTSHKWNIYETSVLLNSGGTRGKGKIIELSSDSINKLASNGADILDMTDGRGIYMLAVLPLFHGFGLCMGIHAPLMYGACSNLMMKFNTKPTIKYLNKGYVNIIIGVPALFKALLRNKKFHTTNLQKLKVAYVGGDFVSNDLVHEFNKVMEKYGSSARLFEGYGLTETVTVCSVNTFRNNKLGSVGQPVRYARIKVVGLENREDLGYNTLGEIAVSGDIIMNGYYQSDDLNSKVFIKDKDDVKWVLTGDYGYIDNDNYLYFKQRLKRIVKVSGIIVCPSEVENVTLTIDGVHSVYATSINDEEKDHMIYLFVVKDNKYSITDEELTKNIKKVIESKLSIYAVPKVVKYIDEMPRTEIGKIDGKILDKLVTEE